jgi:hypothetical protein
MPNYLMIRHVFLKYSNTIILKMKVFILYDFF